MKQRKNEKVSDLEKQIKVEDQSVDGQDRVETSESPDKILGSPPPRDHLNLSQLEEHS